MLIGRRHYGTLGLLWVADFLLLFMLIPSNPNGRGVVTAVALWLVPTAALAAATWFWWRRIRSRGSDA